MEITCILTDHGEPFGDPLIYVVTVDNPHDYDQVKAAVLIERNKDRWEPAEDEDLSVLFSFAGNLPTLTDWRG